MEQCIANTSKHVAIKDLGEASNYCDCYIPRNRKGRMLELNQHLYIKTIAERFEVMQTTTIPVAAGSIPL